MSSLPISLSSTNDTSSAPDMDTSQQRSTSLALNFPYEIIEAIVVNLKVPDLYRAAAHLPTPWREVVQSSLEIWQRLARYDYNDEIVNVKTHSLHEKSETASKQDGETIKGILRKGWLFARASWCRQGGLIFAPSANESEILILDAERSGLRRCWHGKSAYWSIVLYNLQGNVVCTEDLADVAGTVATQYFQHLRGDQMGQEVMERPKKRKKQRTE